MNATTITVRAWGAVAADGTLLSHFSRSEYAAREGRPVRIVAHVVPNEDMVAETTEDLDSEGWTEWAMNEADLRQAWQVEAPSERNSGHSYDSDEGRTNDDRQDDAALALQAWEKATGSNPHDETNIRDLIADLLHLARACGLDPEHEAEMALHHFAAEVNGDPEESEADEVKP